MIRGLHEPVPGPVRSRRTRSLRMSGADGRGGSSSTRGSAEQPLSAVHRTILVVDVVGFGGHDRTNAHQIGVRQGMYRVIRWALHHSGIPRSRCRLEDRGDGVFLLIQPDVPKGLFVEALPNHLLRALVEHNDAHGVQERIQLRVALHAGEVNFDEYGVTGASINLAFRLLDAAPVRDALAKSAGLFALVTSSWFFEEVVRHSAVVDSSGFGRILVQVKETTATGWLRVESGNRGGRTASARCVSCAGH